jgi:hypothetical protein
MASDFSLLADVTRPIDGIDKFVGRVTQAAIDRP